MSSPSSISPSSLSILLTHPSEELVTLLFSAKPFATQVFIVIGSPVDIRVCKQTYCHFDLLGNRANYWLTAGLSEDRATDWLALPNQVTWVIAYIVNQVAAPTSLRDQLHTVRNQKLQNNLSLISWMKFLKFHFIFRSISFIQQDILLLYTIPILWAFTWLQAFPERVWVVGQLMYEAECGEKKQGDGWMNWTESTTKLMKVVQQHVSLGTVFNGCSICQRQAGVLYVLFDIIIRYLLCLGLTPTHTLKL